MKKYFSIAVTILLCGSSWAQQKRATSMTPSVKTGTPVVKAPMNSPTQGRFSSRAKAVNIYSTNTDYTLEDGTTIKQSFNFNTGQKAFVKSPSTNSVKRLERNEKDLAAERENNGWKNCSTKEVRITASNMTDMYIDNSAQMSNIKPGLLYKYEDYIKGNWKTINDNKHPITLITDVKNTNGAPSIEVPNPNETNISNAINTLFSRHTNVASETSSQGFIYKCSEIESQSDLLIKVGASGYGFGFSASALFSSKKSEKHRYLLIDATKSMFSIKTSVGANGIIDPAYATRDMMYISNVSYGARVLAVAELETYDAESNAKAEAGIDYAVAGGSANFEYFSKQFNSKAVIKMYVVGGQSDQVTTVYTFDDVKKVCANILRTLNYKNAQPIKYQFSNVNNDLVLSNSATDYFITQSCVYTADAAKPADRVFTASISSIMPINISETDLEIYGQVWAQAFDGKNREVFPENRRDRLLDIKQNQHLNAGDIKRSYSPNIEASFKIPGDALAGAKIIVYYYLWDYDVKPNPDDFLSMRNGVKKIYSGNKADFYVHEFYLNAAANGPQLKTGEFVDEDGDSGIKLTTQVEVDNNK
ncbi:MAG: hypothetical protein JST81_05235 [Bacteroidetes bacterium]|nr:hypothetical protein [Bacteroidota bacterium]